MTEQYTSDTERITDYSCPECGEYEWHIQNRVAPAAAFFDPKITHVECVNCGFTDEATTDTSITDTERNGDSK